jgi:hypothetical protein
MKFVVLAVVIACVVFNVADGATANTTSTPTKTRPSSEEEEEEALGAGDIKLYSRNCCHIAIS